MPHLCKDLHLKWVGGPGSQVLGLDQPRRARRWLGVLPGRHDLRSQESQPDSAVRQRIDQRFPSRRGSSPHLRGIDLRRGQVLGSGQHGPAWKWFERPFQHPRPGLWNLRGDRRLSRKRVFLRLEQRSPEVLGTKQQRPVGQRHNFQLVHSGHDDGGRRWKLRPDDVDGRQSRDVHEARRQHGVLFPLREAKRPPAHSTVRSQPPST